MSKRDKELLCAAAFVLVSTSLSTWLVYTYDGFGGISRAYIFGWVWVFSIKLADIFEIK